MHWIWFGLGAAFLLGAANIPQKIALGGISTHTLSPFVYGLVTGVIIILINLGLILFYREEWQLFARKEWGFAILAAVMFALGSVCIALGYRQGANAGQFVSLFNTNTLVATILGVVILRETLSVPLWQAILGALFVVLGAMLVTLKF